MALQKNLNSKHAVAQRRGVASYPGTLTPPAQSAGTFDGCRSKQTPGRWRVEGRAARTPGGLGVRGRGVGGAQRCRGAPSLAARGRGSEEPEGRADADPSNAPQENWRASPRRRGAGWRRGPTRPLVGAGCSWGGPAARPSPRHPARPSPPPGVGRTHSMIRETCSRTGTLLSLKAVVMKQPNVSAAITLSEKANSEFARDSTVFISADAPRAHRGTGTAGTPFRQRTGSRLSAPPAPRVPGTRAAAAPPPFRSRTRSSARAPAARTHPPAGGARAGPPPVPSSNQRRGGAELRPRKLRPLGVTSLARPGSPCPSTFLRLLVSLGGTVAS